MGKRRLLSAVLLVLAGASQITGQIPHSQVIFAYLGLATDSAMATVGLRDTEIQVLENRIRGCLLDIARQENYSITSPKNAAAMLSLIRQRQTERFQEELLVYSTSLTASGVLAFRLDRDASGSLRLLSSMYAVPGAEAVAESAVVDANLDSLLSRVPAQVYGLFGLAAPGPVADRVAQAGRSAVGAFSRDRDLQLRDIAGTWQGDYDFTKVEIKADGSGVIWLNATETMRVRVSVDSQTVTVRQDEPNSPKMYLSVFPYTIAVQVVRLARPMSWQFKVTPELDRMVGKKETSYFYIEKSKVLQVDNTYSRDAVWTRIP
jgi:hypothetical protein